MLHEWVVFMSFSGKETGVRNRPFLAGANDRCRVRWLQSPASDPSNRRNLTAIQRIKQGLCHNRRPYQPRSSGGRPRPGPTATTRGTPYGMGGVSF